jgi:catechol 2,3-dioxygenase-like lactoylglutathione lyase family enzyme
MWHLLSHQAGFPIIFEVKPGWFIDRFEEVSATVVSEVGRNGYRLNLHGLMVNVSGLIETQTREQHYGMEHLAVDTDDYPATMATLRGNGVKILEEMVGSGGRRVGFCEGPDGTQMEIIEQLKA